MLATEVNKGSCTLLRALCGLLKMGLYRDSFSGVHPHAPAACKVMNTHESFMSRLALSAWKRGGPLTCGAGSATYTAAADGTGIVQMQQRKRAMCK